MSKKKIDEDILLDAESENMSILTTEIQAEPDEDISKMEFDKEIPVIPLRNMVMFPHVVMPITIGRPSTLKLVNSAFKKKSPVALMCQISSETEDPGYKDIYHVGVLARQLLASIHQCLEFISLFILHFFRHRRYHPFHVRLGFSNAIQFHFQTAGLHNGGCISTRQFKYAQNTGNYTHMIYILITRIFRFT